MSHRKKSNYSQHTIHTHQTHKSMSRQSKRKRYTKRDHNTDSFEPSQHSLYHSNHYNNQHGHHNHNHNLNPHNIAPNYRQSSLQIQNVSSANHQSRSQYSHHSHSQSTFHRSNYNQYNQYRNNHEFLSDIQSQSNEINECNDHDDDNKELTEEEDIDDEYYNHNHNRRHMIGQNNNNNNNINNIEQILKAVRREYQQQVDHVISKWKELLDRSQSDVEKYRNTYHLERAHNKKLQQTIDQLRSKLKKYKNKDNENQMIIIDLQQRLNDVYENLTEITTPSQTPNYYHNMYNKPKLPLVSPKKIIRHSNDSFYNYVRQSNNNIMMKDNMSMSKTPLKTSLPPPNTVLSPKRRNSISHIDDINDIHDMNDRHVNDIMQHKIVKTRDDLKKILDRIDDNNVDNSVNLSSTNTQNNTSDNINIIIKYKDKLFKNKSNTIKVCQSINLNEFVSQLCDSININKEIIQLQHHTKIIETNEKKNMKLSLAQLDIHNFDNIFVYINYSKLLQIQTDANENKQTEDELNEPIELFQQCISTNNNPKNMLLLKTSIIRLNEYCTKLKRKQDLYQIITDGILQNNPKLMLKLLCNKVSEIINCQYIRLYFKWNNILQIIYPQEDINIKQQIVVDLNDCKESENDNNNNNQSLLMDIINANHSNANNNNHNHNHMPMMKCYNNPSINNANKFNIPFNKLFNYNIDSTLICPLLFKNEQYIEEQFIGVIQLINKQNTNNFEFTYSDKQLLFPFTKIFAIALKILYHIYSTHKIFDAIHTNDMTNDSNIHIAEYTLFTNTRVNRGVSRAITESEQYYNPKPQSHTISTDEPLNLINNDMKHNSISRNASPIHYNRVHTPNNNHDNISIASSVHSHSTPLFAPMTSPPQIPTPYNINNINHINNINNIIHNENMITNVNKKRQRKRNESEQYHHTFLTNDDSSEHHQQNSIVLNVSEFRKQQQIQQQQKTRRSISNDSNISNSKPNNHENNDDENDELLTPPTPNQNYDNTRQTIM